MKKCIQCGLVKPSTEFNKSSKNKDGLHSYCRDCHKQHYKTNKIRHGLNVKRVRAEHKQKVLSVVSQYLLTGCVDCGTKDIRVLDFDHVRGIKVDNVNNMIRNGHRLEKIIEEIAKCEVRCRNCHAIVTYERIGGSWRDAFVSPLVSTQPKA